MVVLRLSGAVEHHALQGREHVPDHRVHACRVFFVLLAEPFNGELGELFVRTIQRADIGKIIDPWVRLTIGREEKGDWELIENQLSLLIPRERDWGIAIWAA
jgi:hypothetical protein